MGSLRRRWSVRFTYFNALIEWNILQLTHNLVKYTKGDSIDGLHWLFVRNYRRRADIPPPNYHFYRNLPASLRDSSEDVNLSIRPIQSGATDSENWGPLLFVLGHRDVLFSIVRSHDSKSAHFTNIWPIEFQNDPQLNSFLLKGTVGIQSLKFCTLLIFHPSPYRVKNWKPKAIHFHSDIRRGGKAQLLKTVRSKRAVRQLPLARG